MALIDSKSLGGKWFLNFYPASCLFADLFLPRKIKLILRIEMGVEVYKDPKEISVS